MDAKLARGLVRQEIARIGAADHTPILDQVLADMVAACRGRGLSVAARKAAVTRLATWHRPPFPAGLWRHAVDRLRRLDRVMAVYLAAGRVARRDHDERYLSVAGFRLDLQPHQGCLLYPADSVLIGEHALQRWCERAETTPEQGLTPFFDAFWQSMALSLPLLKLAESLNGPPVAVLPLGAGLLLGVRLRIAAGVPRNLALRFDRNGLRRQARAGTLSSAGGHHYLSFRTYIGPGEMTAAQERVHARLSAFLAQGAFPLSELFLALLFNDADVADPRLMDRRYSWSQLAPLLEACVSADWHSILPKELRPAAPR